MFKKFTKWVAPAVGGALGFMVGGPAGAAVGAGLGMGYQGAKERQRYERDAYNQQVAFQKDLAQHGLSWKIEDARKHGVSALAALGAASPSTVSAQLGVSDDWRERLGQDLTRMGNAGLTSSLSRELGALELERARLTNKLLEGQVVGIQQENQRARGLPTPQGMTAPVQPGEVKAEHIADYQWLQTRDGLIPVIPQQLAESLESSPNVFGIAPEQWSWYLRNRLAPRFDGPLPKPDPRLYPLPDGYKWEWSSWLGGYKKVRSRVPASELRQGR